MDLRFAEAVQVSFLPLGLSFLFKRKLVWVVHSLCMSLKQAELRQNRLVFLTPRNVTFIENDSFVAYKNSSKGRVLMSG